jgi:hypothetical protein
MSKINVLQQEQADLTKEARELLDATEKDGRDF